MAKKQLIIIFFSCIVSACAGSGETVTEEAYDKHPAASDCISPGTIRDYRVLDDSNLIVTAGGNRKHHITLSRRAPGLRSSWSLGFRSISGQICTGFGEVVIDDGMGRETIRIASIRRVSPEEIDALLVRLGTKEPEHKPAMAPKEIEGAEVEELD
jgi:hypothetical protein